MKKKLLKASQKIKFQLIAPSGGVGLRQNLEPPGAQGTVHIKESEPRAERAKLN